MRFSIRLRALTLALAMALALTVAGCSAEEDPVPVPRVSDGQPDQAAAALQRLTSAIDEGKARDPQVSDPSIPESVTYSQSVLGNAQKLGVEEFSARFVAPDAKASSGLPSGQWAGTVEISWRIPAASPTLASSEVMMVFAEVGDRVVPLGLVNSGKPSPLWLMEKVSVRRSPRVMVLAAYQPGDTWQGRDYGRFGQQAVRAVDAAIPGWNDRLLLEVPADPEDFDTVLGTTPGSYAEIAAVTASVDGSKSAKAPMHVVFNPAVMTTLTERGAQVVVTHESVHAAMTDPSDAVSPRWLIEGYADHVALRGVNLPESRKAGRIIAQVRRDGAPAALPTDKQLASGADDLEATYEAAWVACTLISDEVGERSLLRLRRLVASGTGLDQALLEVLGTDRAELTRNWRLRLQELAR